MVQIVPRLLRDDEVEQILGVHRGWAAKDRLSNARIPFLRVGRCIRYRESDIKTYLDSCVRRSTSDLGPAVAA